MKLIEADAALEAIRTMQTYKLFSGDDMILIDKAQVQTELMMLPSAQPERKTGRWIESNPQDSKLCRLMTCSECGKAYIVNINVPYEDWTEAHKFCIECGADMRGEAK